MLVAHQGGWDEILLVLAPIALFAVLLLIANKRAAQLADEEDAEADDVE
jgi:hypothetical protein